MRLNAITVAAGHLFDFSGAAPRDLQVLHRMTGAGASGYVSFRVAFRDLATALAQAPVAVTTIARAANVVTVDATAHGLAVGDVAVIREVVPGGATAFNGEFYVATVPGANQFTYAQSGVNDAAATGGKVYAIPTVPYAGEGYNLPGGARTAGYHCRAANFNGLLWVQCNLTAGTHTVQVRDGLGGTGTGVIQYAEDTAHNTGDIGTQVLAVRQDTPAALAGTDGDYIPLTTDSSGFVYVQARQSAHDNLNANANIQVGNADVAVGNPVPVAGTAADGAAAAGNPVRVAGKDGAGNTQDILTDTDGNLQVDVLTSSGQYAEDTAHNTGDIGTQVLAVRKDTVAALVDLDGDYAPLELDASGRLHVNAQQPTHDSLQTNANLQVADTDVSASNPVPIGGAAADDAAAAGNPVCIGALADETSPDSVDEGDVGRLRMTLDRLLRTTDSRSAGAAASHRTPTAIDGKYPPLNSDASWSANPGGRSKCRFYTDLVVRASTALADAPVITFRPYTRNGGSGGYVGAGETVDFTRPTLSDKATIRLQKTTDVGASYTDYSASVIDNNAATQADLDGLDTVANGDWFVIGGPVPFIGAALDMDAANVNAIASVLSVEVWSNGAWAAASNVTDGTASGGVTLAQDGQITWDMPADWDSVAINGITAYWARLSVSVAISANVDVEECDLLMPLRASIDVQADGDDAYLMLESVTGGTGTLAYSGTIYATWR